MALDPVTAHLAWCRHRGLRPSTIAARRYHLDRLARALRRLGCPSLLDATPALLRTWQAGLTMGPSGRRSLVRDARAFYGWAADEGLADAILLRHLVSPRVREGLPRPIPDPDLAVALANAPSRLRPWLLLAAYAGLRACEVAPLRAEHLDLAGRPPTVRVVDGKGGRQRVVPLAPHAVHELRACHLPRRGWLFPKLSRQGEPTGEHVSASQVSHLASRYLHDTGSSSTFHALRHYAGTSVQRAGKNIRVTQEFLGHASIRQAALYTLVVPDELASAVAQAFTQLPVAEDQPPAQFDRDRDRSEVEQ